MEELHFWFDSQDERLAPLAKLATPVAKLLAPVVEWISATTGLPEKMSFTLVLVVFAFLCLLVLAGRISRRRTIQRIREMHETSVALKNGNEQYLRQMRDIQSTMTSMRSASAQEIREINASLVTIFRTLETTVDTAEKRAAKAEEELRLVKAEMENLRQMSKRFFKQY